jgi:hypothetical protein
MIKISVNNNTADKKTAEYPAALDIFLNTHNISQYLIIICAEAQNKKIFFLIPYTLNSYCVNLSKILISGIFRVCLYCFGLLKYIKLSVFDDFVFLYKFYIISKPFKIFNYGNFL